MQLETVVNHLSPAVVILTLHGRLTTGERLDTLESQITGLIDSGVKRILLDVTGLEYFDSAALALLVHLNGDLRDRDGELRIAGPNERIRSVFKLTHTDQMLKIYPDRDSALAGFDA